MFQKQISLLLLLFFLCTCSKPIPDLGPIGKLFPKETLLLDGIVNKYYVHYDSYDKNEKTTDIKYIKYKYEEGKILQTYYNAGFEITSDKIFLPRKNQLFIVSATHNWRQNKFDSQFLDSIAFDLNNPAYIFRSKNIINERYAIENMYNNRVFRDSVMDEIPVFIKEGVLTQVSVFNNNKNKNEINTKEVYHPDFGLFSSTSQDEKGIRAYELVAQMSVNHFEELANHGLHRVGYIDPNKAMDKNSGFETCQSIEKIADYYNGEDYEAEFLGGKKPLWDAINKQLDPEKLHQESGYLSFHFVVNCKGEVGRFTTEEADFDYHKKIFHPDTKQHLFEILSGLKTWSVCNIRGEDRDAYTYITFKLKDGKIFEILP